MHKKSSCFSFALIAILMVPLFARAQDVTDPSLKAAFIYNVAKFNEWPEENSPSKVFSMCVLGDAAVAEALERTVKGRLLRGAEISVTRLTPTGSVRGCRLLYLSGIKKEQAANIVASVRGTPVLTISDLGGFHEYGGIVRLLFEDGQLRFTIDQESAKKSWLQLSTRILKLANTK